MPARGSGTRWTANRAAGGGVGVGLVVRTAPSTYRGDDRVDITRVGVDKARLVGTATPGSVLAPSAGILWPAKAHIDLVGALERRGATLTGEAAAALSGYAIDLMERCDAAYRRLYVAELRVSYGLPRARYGTDEDAAYRNGVRVDRAAWGALLTSESATLVCMCGRREPGGAQRHHCHRHHAAGVLAKLGATDAGEVVADKPAKGTAPRPWPPMGLLVAISGARPPAGAAATPANETAHRAACADVADVVAALPTGTVVVHGGAAGIDAAADAAAKRAGHPVVIVRPWYDAFGRAAPVVRNVYVATAPRAFCWPAPWSSPNGTPAAIRIAKSCGGDVVVRG